MESPTWSAGKDPVSRSKKASLNTAFCFVEEFVSLVCAFILPRLILSAFGSKYNGLTSSISQFLACAVLLRSGIGGATRAALYKPMAANNHAAFNAIVKATDNFMRKIGLILLGSIVLFSTLYPFLVKNEFGWFFTSSLFLIIGMSTFAESFFGITYIIVLQADQQVWIATMFRCVCTVLNTMLGAGLILSGFSLHVVKLGTAMVFVLYPVVLGAYVRRRYHIDTHVAPDNSAIAQRWDAFWHQVALFVMNNTSVVILTLFTNMLEVSVYSVYDLVAHGLKKTMSSFTNGLEGAFGNMIAKNENRQLRRNFAIVENLLYGIATIACTCAALLVFDFVRLYTKNVSDVDYIRYAFGFAMIAAQFFNAIRMPYQLVVQAAGHYRQTKAGAIAEPVINIVVSVALVLRFGLVGVAVGALTATAFRTFQYSSYMGRHLLKRSWLMVPARLAVAVAETGASMVVVHWLDLGVPDNFVAWGRNALVVGGVCTLVVGIGSMVCFPKDTTGLLRKIKGVLA